MALDSTTLLKGGTGRPSVLAGQYMGKLCAKIDCSETNLGTSDTYKLFVIPAGVYVHALVIDVLTAEGGTCTMDVGDSNSATQFTSNTDLNSVAKNVTAYTVAKGYGSADYIVLKMDNAADTAVFTVTAMVSDLSYVDQ